MAFDSDNVFLVLAVNQLNPDLLIAARVKQNLVKKTLLAAGGDKAEKTITLQGNTRTNALQDERVRDKGI